MIREKKRHSPLTLSSKRRRLPTRDGKKGKSGFLQVGNVKGNQPKNGMNGRGKGSFFRQATEKEREGSTPWSPVFPE